MQHSLAEEAPVWRPTTEEEKDLVRQQMNRLLQTTHFRNSRRYPALFRFIVEETLEGRGEYLKERLLGIRVFDRPADYDTATDPVVRVTIAEIRKRIAQYYHEEAHDQEMRIELLPGRYEPEFRPRRETEVVRSAVGREPDILLGMTSSDLAAHVALGEGVLSEAEQPVVADPVLAGAPGHDGPAKRSRRWKLTMILGGAALSVLLLVAAYFAWQWTHPSALEELWGPVLATKQPVTICLPNGAGRDVASADILTEASQAEEKKAAEKRAAEKKTADRKAATGNVPAGTEHDSTFLAHESLGENVVYSDVLATMRVATMLATDKRESRLRLDVATTLDDLRQGPTVLIGGLDNQWTLHALAPLRIRFAGVQREQFWISDREHPEQRNWSLDLRKQYSDVTRDYAIIARIHDEATGQVTVIAAGIGMTGTAAAGEFLVDPRQAAELRRRVGPGFKDHDFEVVLSTSVVHGIAGTPRIEAVAVR